MMKQERQMPKSVVPISLVGVNRYLLRAEEGFVLADTGYANKRATLERRLAEGWTLR